MTYTFVVMELSETAWNKIADNMREADYNHVFVEDDLIDMHGIAVRKESVDVQET